MSRLRQTCPVRRMSAISFFVAGTPKGQPRVRACIRGKRAGVYDPGTADGWKRDVLTAWILAGKPAFSGPLRMELEFTIPRPASHHKGNDKAKPLKPSAPLFHVSAPDIDNLYKAVADILQVSGAYTNDCAIWNTRIIRRWESPSYKAGCWIHIEESQPVRL